MADELSQIETFLTTTLGAASSVTNQVGTRIYGYRLPDDVTTYPAVVFSSQAPDDINGLGDARLATRGIYQIKVVDRHPISTAGVTAFSALDAVLKVIRNTTSSGFVYSIRRLQPISYLEQGRTANESFRHHGGLYEIICSAV